MSSLSTTSITDSPSLVRGTYHIYSMGSAPSSQRGGKATQALRDSTNANMPTDTAQVANMTKEHLNTSNPGQDPRKGNTAPPKNAAGLVSSTTCADATNLDATGIPSSPLGTGSPNSPDAVPPSQALATLEVVAFPYTQDAPNRALAPDRNVLSTVLVQTDTRNLKAGIRPRKRPRRSRGRGKDKDADAPALEETENVPPPAAREDRSSHRRRGRRPEQARTAPRPAMKRGRSENRAGGTETTDSEKFAVTRLAAEGVSGDSKSRSTSRGANAGRTRGNGHRSSAGFRSNSKPPRHLPSRARFGANVPGALAISELVQDVVSAIEEDEETSEVAKANHAKTDEGGHWTDTKDKAVPVQIAPPTDNGTPAALRDEKEEFPAPTSEVDVSTLPPLPSSTRRRAKEYFQRRTRERSVDAETGPPSRGATVAEQGRRTDEKEPNPRLHTKEEAGIKRRPARWSVPVSNKNHDQFAFDPEASPFTPNATSSPRQGSLSSIGVQSFSSPSPLPPHGNRKVAPLTLVETSGKSNTPETIDSSTQPIPVTQHGTQGGQHGDTYTYCTGRDRAQVHLQAEQLAILQLQAYYSWLAGNISTSVGVISTAEHMNMSGGGGGLSGGVVLGRQGQGRSRGKTQSRNASGAYAHPKEHVVYSPRGHERAQLGPGTNSQRDGELGLDERPEGVAQRTIQKWDGGWGSRGVSGREVGWNWGRENHPGGHGHG